MIPRAILENVSQNYTGNVMTISTSNSSGQDPVSMAFNIWYNTRFLHLCITVLFFHIVKTSHCDIQCIYIMISYRGSDAH